MAVPAVELDGFDDRDPVWQDFAACKGEPDLFFPERGEDVRPAKNLCSLCPVRSECLEHALRYERYGIWGGTSERERKRMRRILGIRLVELVIDEPLDEPEDADDVEDDEWQ